MITRVVQGNDFQIKITVVQPQYTIDGTVWEDFNLLECTNVRVSLICNQHKVVIPLSWYIEDGTENIIIADIIGAQLHVGAVYGVQITGLDGEDKAWRYNNASVFSVVDQTKNSVMNTAIMNDPLELRTEISLFAECIPVPGPQGVQGAQGEAGPQGEKGNDGDVSFDELTPEQKEELRGPQGNEGQQGAQGEAGPQGDKGEVGPQGIEGQQGVQGEVGPQGEKGQDGEVSFEELTPEQKEELRGPQGFQGEVGVQGNQGDKGETGVQGDNGVQGSEGAQGPQGIEGAKGTQGDKGVQGDRGVQGSVGENGLGFDYDYAVEQGFQGTPEEFEQFATDSAFGLATIQDDVQSLHGEVNYLETHKQDTLVSGQNIKTVNNQSLLGSGNINIESGSDVEIQKLDFGPQAPASPVEGHIYITTPPITFKSINGQEIVGDGDISEVGPQGPQGEKGTDGTNGVQGSEGAQGVQGEIGPQGPQGNDGTNGVQGSEGAQGVQGEVGPQGPQGTQGNDGTNGVQGSEGPQGPQGQKGESGVYDYSKMYLTFEAIESGTFTFTISNLQYSTDNGTTWTTLSASTASPTVTAGNKIMWKQTGLTPSNSGIGTFSATGKFKVYGNIMSLYYGANFNNQTSLSGKNYAFRNLFANNTYLIDASNLILPATTLSNYCYQYMFNGCTNLTSAPNLPATTLTQYCYSQMFKSCSSLTSAPNLPATTLASSCYDNMFYGCTNIIIPPALPATTLASSCYASMFSWCTNLLIAPKLPATTLASTCYANMFEYCTSLTSAPVLSTATLAYGCYMAMFKGCSNISSITMLATDISASNCLLNWVLYVSSSGTLTKAASMTTLPSGASGIPTGWDVDDSNTYSVSSSTSGLKLEVVSALPASPDANTIYIVQ